MDDVYFVTVPRYQSINRLFIRALHADGSLITNERVRFLKLNDTVFLPNGTTAKRLVCRHPPSFPE